MAVTTDDSPRPAHLEALRRSLDLRMDAEGRWWHDGQPFAHPRLTALFDRGVDLHPDTGEPILRVDDTWCYFRADDTPFQVRRLALTGDTLTATLNNGQQLALGPGARFEVDGDHVYLTAAPRRRARLTRQAQAALADWLDEDEDGPVVCVGAARWRVGSTPAG